MLPLSLWLLWGNFNWQSTYAWYYFYGLSKLLPWSNEPTGWDSELVSLQCGLVCFVYFKDKFCSHNNSDCRWSWFVSLRLKLGSELYTNCSSFEFTYTLSLALSVTFSCISPVSLETFQGCPDSFRFYA